MTKMKFEDKLAEIEKQIAEIKKQLKEKEESDKKWKPDINEIYYYITDAGSHIFTRNCEFGEDVYRIHVGNCFKTEEEAKEYKKKIEFQTKFRNYVKEHSEKIDWSNNDQYKYYLYYNYGNDKIEINWYFTFKVQNVIYASSDEILKDAIAEFGEENIKKYILEVE